MLAAVVDPHSRSERGCSRHRARRLGQDAPGHRGRDRARSGVSRRCLLGRPRRHSTTRSSCLEVDLAARSAPATTSRATSASASSSSSSITSSRSSTEAPRSGTFSRNARTCTSSSRAASCCGSGTRSIPVEPLPGEDAALLFAERSGLPVDETDDRALRCSRQPPTRRRARGRAHGCPLAGADPRPARAAPRSLPRRARH